MASCLQASSVTQTTLMITLMITIIMENTWRERIWRILSRILASQSSARIRRVLTMCSPQLTTATSTSRWRIVNTDCEKFIVCIFQALIDELFHPSSTTTTTTTTPATTSTQRLPIKAHELGWELSPIDLVMANSVLEPVFSDDQKQVRVRIMFQERKLSHRNLDILVMISNTSIPYAYIPIQQMRLKMQDSDQSTDSDTSSSQDSDNDTLWSPSISISFNFIHLPS